ncbi:MAG: bifunctional 4-hydroxy-2-oxoglutarate aldolase/2-dehydro-3-deoxy-phosphogluconate aldolase [Lachnospiraceae bacterium]|nr:bifunctional 4-hydroxy-2-oxoglutarate aldolase/2-dehydro-3-deoxy-phosphogluconate aldolase [Lachnospiraceae bacterium]
MNELLNRIHDIGIVPVIAIDDADKAVPLARALVDGGLPAAEVTFRTAAAEEAIRNIIREVPEMLVGAGTVLTREQADRAIDAGVSFIVSPGFNPDITGYVIDRGVCMLPGTATAGEMEQAMALGLEAVKFFPAEQNGGVDKLKALAGPYKTLKWMPTGGVNTGNLVNYLSFDQVLACGGTWMVKKELIEGEKWDEITSICKSAVTKMLGLEIDNIGIKSESIKRPFFEDFGLKITEHNDMGTGGCITVTAINVDRAVYHLSRAGAKFDEDSRIRDDKGTQSIYLDGEIGGFAIRFSRK